MALGVWVPAVTRFFLLSLPLVAAAILPGMALNHRMKDHGIFRIVYVALIVIGGELIAQSFIAS